MIRDARLALAILHARQANQAWEEFAPGNWDRSWAIRLNDRLHQEKRQLRKIATGIFLTKKSELEGTPPYIDLAGRRYSGLFGWLQDTKLHRDWTDADYQEAEDAAYIHLIESQKMNQDHSILSPSSFPTRDDRNTSALKALSDVDRKDLGIEENATFEQAKEQHIWGSYHPIHLLSRPPIYRRLIELNTDHLENILADQHHILEITKRIIIAILRDRH